MDEYLSVKDVAKMLLLSEQTILKWVQLGRITPIRVRRVLRFEKKKLIRQLEKYEYGGPPKDDPAMG